MAAKLKIEKRGDEKAKFAVGAILLEGPNRRTHF
jgi:hypothetical protein